MTVLGIESSCDETAVAIVRDGDEVLASVVYSQVPLHRPYGGVVPEVASRAHVAKIRGVAEEALARAFPGESTPWDRVDAIAATRGPGLAAALLVGWTFAKGLALALGKPLIPVNHMHAHLWSVRLGHPELRGQNLWPQLGLAVSGGHTCFVASPEPNVYRLLGQTIDDAAGEAFDKAAKLLGLGYPGGPAIDKLARQAPEGADRAIHMSDRKFAGADTLATSHAIAGALRMLDFDLVITGRQAIDGDTAQVGPQIAEHLDLPQVTYVEDLQFDGDKTFTIRKSTEEGYQIVQVESPCVITVLSSANKARYMSVRGIVEAYDREVEVWTYDNISVAEEKLGLKGSPTRVWKSFTKGAKAAGKVFEVEPNEAVDIIIEKLKEKFII